MATGRKRTAPDGSGDPKWTPPGQQSKALPPAYQRNQSRTGVPFKDSRPVSGRQTQPKGAQPLNPRPGVADPALEMSPSERKRAAILRGKK